MNTSDILNKAADLIEERGWIYGCGWPLKPDERKPLCLEGGILAARGMVFDDADDESFWDECPTYKAVSDYLASPVLWEWNDEKGRTQSEVIEVLRATALVEAARESQPAEVSA